MTNTTLTRVLLAAMLTASAGLALAAAAQRTAELPQMDFFVTSRGLNRGGNLGGLAGADAHCQMLADAVGAGTRTWRAYLSTQARPGQPAVNARDRIGAGPWRNAKGQIIAANQTELHGDTLEAAQLGSNLFKLSAFNERGEVVKGVGDTPVQHDMLTGSQTDGRAFTDAADHTCNNWTSEGPGTAQVGHSDRVGGGNTSWNSSHATRGCSQKDLIDTGGAGYFYCFAAN
jgi:hypothetical protein